MAGLKENGLIKADVDRNWRKRLIDVIRLHILLSRSTIAYRFGETQPVTYMTNRSTPGRSAQAPMEQYPMI